MTPALLTPPRRKGVGRRRSGGGRRTHGRQTHAWIPGRWRNPGGRGRARKRMDGSSRLCVNAVLVGFLFPPHCFIIVSPKVFHIAFTHPVGGGCSHPNPCRPPSARAVPGVPGLPPPRGPPRRGAVRARTHRVAETGPPPLCRPDPVALPAWPRMTPLSLRPGGTLSPHPWGRLGWERR